jgi:pyruvate,water dikinase
MAMATMHTRYTIPFDELRQDDVALVGGKCANLGELTQAGFPVPPGFAVTTAAYERDDIGKALGEAYVELGSRVGRADPPVAVRSSAIAEDLPDASFAGVQDTYLWICGLDAVHDGVRRCWASFYNPEAIAYREAHGISRGGMGVAVQYMVDARVAGVMFTLNPVSGDPSSIAIDASYGRGISVAGGEVTPDSFLVSKVTREIVRRQIGAKEIEVVADVEAATTVTRDVAEELRALPSLTDSEIVALADLGRRVEAHYACPQDVEWAIDRSLDEVLLLQARPETVWSRRPRPQAVAGSPLALIAATMTGGTVKPSQ